METIIERTDEQLRNDMLKNEDCQYELSKYNLWSVANHNHWELSHSGTMEECEEKQNGDIVNYEIHRNDVRDIWENCVAGIGYVTFQNGVTHSF